MSIEENFDIPLIAAMALKEKQIQQNYRPIIAVHKWFARRPGTLFRGLILSEFGGRPVADTFFQANNLPGRTIADPFMGGGTPLLEANRVGCDIVGFDINPMATWIVREEIEHLDLQEYRREAERVITSLEQEIGELYRTDCPLYGESGVPVKYFLWVKTLDCEECGTSVDLFPGYLVAKDARHPHNVVVCPCCGELNEIGDLQAPGGELGARRVGVRVLDHAQERLLEDVLGGFRAAHHFVDEVVDLAAMAVDQGLERLVALLLYIQLQQVEVAALFGQLAL
ncbi:MAG TPA: hypothetical protein PKJ93_11600, partial [Methanoculleus sp.]|nr:hypothetical protein [Methanoculleus sp.]